MRIQNNKVRNKARHKVGNGGLQQGGYAIKAMLSLVLLVGGLTACSSALPSKPVTQQSYDWGVLSAAQSGDDSAAATSSIRPLVVVHRATAPSKLSGNRMWYRLAYKNAQQLLPYRDSKWADSPASMFENTLLAQLGQQFNALKAAEKVGMADYARPALELRLELVECSQIYTAPDTSDAVLQVRATLSQRTGGQVALLYTGVLQEKVPAGANANTGARAMQIAATQMAQKIQAMMARYTASATTHVHFRN